MKSLSAKSGVILLLVGLTISSAKVWGADWKEFGQATTGVFYYDTASIRPTSEGFVQVWIHNVTKQETNLVEFNCKERWYHVLDVIRYDEAKSIKSRETYYDNPTRNWYGISPKSVPGSLYRIVCP